MKATAPQCPKAPQPADFASGVGAEHLTKHDASEAGPYNRFLFSPFVSELNLRINLLHRNIFRLVGDEALLQSFPLSDY